MEVNLESYPAFKVIGIVWHGKMQDGPKEIPQFWEKTFLPRAQEIKNAKIEAWGLANSYGVMWNFNMEEGEMDYLAGVEVENKGSIPEGMIMWEIPSQTYAVTSAPLSKLPEIFKTFEKWFPQSDYKRIPGVAEFELYGEEFHKEDGKGPVKYYIPIEKANK